MSETASRRIYYLAAIAIVAIVLISAIAVTRPASIQPTGTTAGTKTLQVTGIGTVTAAPDQAVVLLAVRTQALTATQASADNAAIMSKVMDALIGAGVSKNSVETVSYSLTPIYESKPDQMTPPRIVGYAARNAIKVTLTDFRLVGRALDAAVSAGANEVQGIMFSFSSAAFAALQRQALQIAIQNADAEAKAMVSSLGVSIVGPISVTLGYTSQPRFETISPTALQTPIQPGTLQVTATVQVTYQFS